MRQVLAALVIASSVFSPATDCFGSLGQAPSARLIETPASPEQEKGYYLGDPGQCIGLRSGRGNRDPFRLRGRDFSWNCLPLRD